VIQSGLIRASEYEDKRWGGRWRGYKKTTTQGLDWPRLDAYDDDDYVLSGVPDQLAKATNEYAARALRLFPLAPDPELPYQDRATLGQTSTQNLGSGPGKVRFRSVEVGPIRKSVGYDNALAGSITADGMPSFPEADMLLRELLTSRTSREIGRA
jgi:hypothetical protein